MGATALMNHQRASETLDVSLRPLATRQSVENGSQRRLMWGTVPLEWVTPGPRLDMSSLVSQSLRDLLNHGYGRKLDALLI